MVSCTNYELVRTHIFLMQENLCGYGSSILIKRVQACYCWLTDVADGSEYVRMLGVNCP